MAAAGSERATQARGIALLKARGAWVLRTHQDGRNRPGIPDVVACYKGYFVAIEWKSPLGGAVRPAQRLECARIREAGGASLITHRVEDVEELLDRIDEWNRYQRVVVRAPRMVADSLQAIDVEYVELDALAEDSAS